ncbi:MAG: winged helix-turn-helix domain-containing protein [Xanthomonadales bacterium]|nr:winged helix-turn-helix domain-containing protein [Xanthomonadales bacterium]
MNNRLIQFGDFTLDVKEKKVSAVNGQESTLNWKNFSVLMQLLDQQNKLVTREQLIEQVWEGNFLVGDKAISTAIWKLRKVLEGSSVSIDTIPKKGYRLSVPLVETVNHSPPTPNAEPPPAKIPTVMERWKLLAGTGAVLLLFVLLWSMMTPPHSSIDHANSTNKIALLTRVIGDDPQRAAEQFIEQIERSIQSSSGFSVVSAEEQSRLLRSQQYLATAAEMNIHSILYLTIKFNGDESMVIDARLESVAQNAFQSAHWESKLSELELLENELLDLLPEVGWQ